MSEIEDKLVFAVQAVGLPEPEREYVFAPPRRWRFDLAWPQYLLACEVEGGLYIRGRHQRPAGYEDDCIKYSEAALRGWCVLRVTAAMVEDGRALHLIERAFGRGLRDA